MIWVGTSGYNYPEWRGSFYPPGLPTADMLPFYVRHFPTVEINYTSYHFPTAKNIEGWASGTPPTFKLALKVPRRVTYSKPGPRTPGLLRSFCDLAALLGPKQAPILMQLPPEFPRDDALLQVLLAAVPRNVQAAIELRDASWHDDAVFSALREHSVVLCISDSETLTTPVVQTGGFGYFRLRHEGYSDADVAAWGERIQDWHAAGLEVFVYFKHEGTGSGPRYASLLMQQLGLPPPAESAPGSRS